MPWVPGRYRVAVALGARSVRGGQANDFQLRLGGDGAPLVHIRGRDADAERWVDAGTHDLGRELRVEVSEPVGGVSLTSLRLERARRRPAPAGRRGGEAPTAPRPRLRRLRAQIGGAQEQCPRPRVVHAFLQGLEASRGELLPAAAGEGAGRLPPSPCRARRELLHGRRLGAVRGPPKEPACLRGGAHEASRQAVVPARICGLAITHAARALDPAHRHGDAALAGDAPVLGARVAVVARGAGRRPGRLDHEPAIHQNPMLDGRRPVRPSDAQLVDRGDAAEAEVRLGRILRDEVASGAELADLRATAGADRDARPDRLAIRGMSAQRDGQVMPGVAAVVPEEAKGSLVVGHEEVEVAIPVVVEGDDATSLAGVVDAELGRALREGRVAVRHEDPRRVEVELRRHGARERTPPVHVHEVEVPVVVQVRERAPPAPVPDPDARLVGAVLEGRVAEVPIQAIPRDPPGPFGDAVRVPDARHEPVEASVAVVVADGGAHPVLVRDDRRGHIREGAVAGVPQDLARAEVRGHEEIGPAIVVEVGKVGGEGEVELRVKRRARERRQRRRRGHVGEVAAAVVPPEMVARVRRQPRAPVRHEEVEIAVTVIVSERGREALADGREPGGGRDVLKRAVAPVAEQARLGPGDSEDQEVEVPVTVDVRQGRACAAGAGHGHAGGRTHLGERAVAAVPEEEVRPHVSPRRVEVEPAIAVVVAAGDAPRGEQRLGLEVAASREVDVAVVVLEPGIRRDVHELPGTDPRRRGRRDEPLEEEAEADRPRLRYATKGERPRRRHRRGAYSGDEPTVNANVTLSRSLALFPLWPAAPLC